MIAAPFLPILVLIWPLTLAFIAALPRMRRHAVRLLPFAPLPALWFAFARPQEPSILPELLLGAELAAVPAGRLLLALTAALWLAAALYAQAYMKDTTKPAVFAGFWCLTLAGNLGVFLSADVVTFYMAFATVSLAAYILIVHEATAPALRAGRIYIVMVIFGEVCLLTAFVIGIAAADSLSIADIRAALSDAPLGGLAALLLVTGFGIKAGLMPLHVWLPLAHPAAPTPASAVLSGAIVKAGIIGMILFLPAGLNFADWLVALGLAGAFAGAVFGLLEINPKTILAYSTISQMSLVTALIAAAGGGGDGSEQIAFYAVHHGLAKGALFLSVGLVAASGGRWRAAILAAVVLIALSVAGAPLTGGGVVKLAAKSTLSGAAETALTLTAITTTLVLTWFVTRLALTEPDGKSALPECIPCCSDTDPRSGGVGRAVAARARLVGLRAWLSASSVIALVVGLADYDGVGRRHPLGQAAGGGRAREGQVCRGACRRPIGNRSQAADRFVGSADPHCKGNGCDRHEVCPSNTPCSSIRA